MKLNSLIKSWINKYSHAEGIAHGLNLRKKLSIKAESLIRKGIRPIDVLAIIQKETSVNDVMTTQQSE